MIDVCSPQGVRDIIETDDDDDDDMPWIYEVGMIDVIWNLSEDERLMVGALEGVDIIFERSEARSSADLDEIGFWGVHPCGRFKGNIMSTIPDGVEDDI
jgi:hypothetical protein